MVITDDKILSLWYLCQSAFLQQGHKLNFPKNTAPQKTYQWRYLETLQKRFDIWQFDHTTQTKFIEVAAKYARDNRLIQKGLAIFFQNNIMLALYKQTQIEANRQISTIESIEQIHNWLHEQAKNQPLVDVLMKRQGLGSYTNIIRWYDSHRISDVYLSLSKSCLWALARLERINPTERAVVPKSIKLVMINKAFTSDVNTKIRARQILQDDWKQ